VNSPRRSKAYANNHDLPYDPNRDYHLDNFEYASFQKAMGRSTSLLDFDKADTNGSKLLSWNEVKAMETSLGIFASADVDQDK